MPSNHPFQFVPRHAQIPGLPPEAIKYLEDRDKQLEDFLNNFNPGAVASGTTSWLENYGLGARTLAGGEEIDEITISNTLGVPLDAPPVDGPLTRDLVYHTVHLSVKFNDAVVPKNFAMRILEPDHSPMIASPYNGFRVREREEYGDGFGQAGEPYTWTFTAYVQRKNYWIIQFQNYGDEEVSFNWTVSIQANIRHQYGGST